MREVRDCLVYVWYVGKLFMLCSFERRMEEVITDGRLTRCLWSSPVSDRHCIAIEIG